MTEQKKDEARERAAELRKEIDELLKRGTSQDAAGESAASGEKKPKSLRDFIHDRMRELDEKKGSAK